MMELPSLTEQICYHCSFLGCGRTSNHFLMIFLDDCCAHFADNAAEGVMNKPKAINQSMVDVSCSQKPQGDGQP